ncbi:hypothetical protein K4Q22_00930 [Staphylococcus epidermidis]|uniref:hypothetical protein n=1 Tax=Staphylococcus epidermidis TaxID=1282 RepID=UPI002884F569|nr:hypothetical protein [Staphylococcus epidermidis]MCG2360589.1 hypothetical protein [Staphylococcus epidermidis]MDT0741417.1 hypothetical protein [Staphylococcus epidermidis]
MEQILIERYDDTCNLYNKKSNFKLGERPIDVITQIIPDIEKQVNDTKGTYTVSNDDLRKIGINAEPMKMPLKPFAFHNK